MNWKDQGNPGKWLLNMVTVHPSNGAIYGVGTGNNIGLWDTPRLGWIEQSKYGSDILMIAFETTGGSTGTMWCVKTDNNLYKWHTEKWIRIQTNNSPVAFKMVAFQPTTGTMWCVNTAGELMLNTSTNDSPTFVKQDGVNWALQWAAFSSKDPASEVYCIGTEGNIGILETDHPHQGIAQLTSNFGLKMVHFGAVNALCVGTDGNVGFYSEAGS